MPSPKSLLKQESPTQVSKFLLSFGAMASHVDRGREVVVASKGFKRLKKEVASKRFKRLMSSSAQKAPPSRRFGAKVMEKHGLKWFNAQKEAKYAPKNWIDESRLALEFPTIHGTVRELGLGSFNAFLGTPVVDPEMYFMLLEKPPYHVIRHTFCGENSAAQWERGKSALIRHSHSPT
ncbi:hypothetical protein HAX54_022824 [Datura stramonium]|uniref:Uncharacterized protein n=1 Tax=Datura stramonium TaxID=4076 RepID=A0ABS8UY05_DATST|nr:hypothetical protein [Datura stramonium]